MRIRPAGETELEHVEKVARDIIGQGHGLGLEYDQQDISDFAGDVLDVLVQCKIFIDCLIEDLGDMGVDKGYIEMKQRERRGLWAQTLFKE